ncbi:MULTISPECIES: hypothetical protein [Pedobacter]|uniref:hypothetical protein n=1 Tax=Pedobacter TaxID=84567 RepID=UPI00064990D9|nr:MULTISPECIES: hypothetical protein [Pedobacter]KLT64451.1 hypothetical protein AB669_18115 [Pedobacter sp. BMA]
MSPTFKILYLFESSTLFIVEVKRLDLPDSADLSDLYQWLYLDRQNGAFIKLWFNSMDSSPAVEERYFEQGYLKFNEGQATFIEKYNSAQHTLINKTKNKPDPNFLALLEDYFS